MKNPSQEPGMAAKRVGLYIPETTFRGIVVGVVEFAHRTHAPSGALFPAYSDSEWAGISSLGCQLEDT